MGSKIAIINVSKKYCGNAKKSMQSFPLHPYTLN